MDPLTDSELDEIGRVEQAATKGPWCQAIHVNEPRALVSSMKMGTSLLSIDLDGMAIVDRAEDAQFIVVARNILPRLLAEVMERRRDDAKWIKLADAIKDVLPYVHTYDIQGDNAFKHIRDILTELRIPWRYDIIYDKDEL